MTSQDLTSIKAAALPTAIRTQGIQHFQRREYLQALACFDRCLAIETVDRELLNYKARVLEGLNRIEDSLRCIEQYLRVDPTNIDEMNNRAVLLTKLARREEALNCLDEVLLIRPKHVDVLLKRAHLLYQLGRKEQALQSAERAVAAAPTDSHALNMRGMILDEMNRRQEALADFLAILSREPNNADALTNRGIIHGRCGEFQEAIACYNRSLQIQPNQPNAFYNRAVVRLALGDWKKGFLEFESRWSLFPHEAARLTRLAPLWTGAQPIMGKTLLLHHEQGYGDTLQFSRYAEWVAARGARVLIAVPKGLAVLMATLPGSPRIVSEGEPVPHHDYHCPLMSLPAAFGTTPETVPASGAYLRADLSCVARWAQRLPQHSRLRIGLVWSGRQFPPINHARDMSLKLIRPLFDLDADFVCLHTELSGREREELAALPNVTWAGELLKDFADTAALIENLDLVITVDSAVAHLAGALGKPVWLMNRYASCWRWLLHRTDSPWYPTMRLFRQPTLGDWRSVVRAVLEAGAWLIQEARRQTLNSQSTPHSAAEAPLNLKNMLQHALDLHNRGECVLAVAQYRRILKDWPDQFDTLHYLGVALAQLDQFEEALSPLSQALRMNNDHAVAHNHYGNVLAGLNRHREAIVSYGRALALDPSLADAHYNSGVAFTAVGEHDAALACYSRAIECHPGYAQAHNNRGSLLAELGQISEPLLDYEAAILAQPHLTDAWINRSHLLRRLHRHEEALRSSDEAVRHDPKNPDAHNSRGATLADLGQDEAALQCYEQALALSPDHPEALWNKGLILLSHGILGEGFRLYEQRWAVKSLKLVRRLPHIQEWRGDEPIQGKVILVHAEQGYGETLQFSRYATLLAARGARVILSIPEALTSLLSSVPGVEQVVVSGTEVPFDVHCSLMSLPLALGTVSTDIPTPPRYLRPHASIVARWAARLAKHKKAPRIGLAWSGKPSHANDKNRSLPFDTIAHLLDPRLTWISLQKEVRAADQLSLSTEKRMLRWGEAVTDFADTAGLIENLDLIITVDTAIAHLAGALGKPVWILLPIVADWRWLRERDDSPWYPTARLFRQTIRADWAGVIAEVAHELGRQFPQPVMPKRLIKKSKMTRH
jgi:tetratricopeptide (TPR) repeat protein